MGSLSARKKAMRVLAAINEQEFVQAVAQTVAARTQQGGAVRAEDSFAKKASEALRGMTGKSFPASDRAALFVRETRHVLVNRPKGNLDFVVPLVVEYQGSASPEEWAAAEQAMEAETLKVMRAIAGGAYPEFKKIVFRRRFKSDPFEQDPASLTLLRFRIPKPA